MLRLSLALASLIPCLAAAADRPTDHQAHAWFAYFGDHPIGTSRWGAHLEGQVRRHDFGGTWQQLLLRPAVNYTVNSQLMLTAGYAYVRSHSYNDNVARMPTSNEHRIWQQAWFRYGERVRWSTRLRFEERFLGSRYENRFRGWQQVTVPLTEKLYATAYDEIWLYVKPYVSNSAFDQNRAYGGIGVRAQKNLRFEVAYMNQMVLLRSGQRMEQNHTLVLSIFSDRRF